MLPLLLTLLLAGDAPAPGAVWAGFRGAGDSRTAARNLPLAWSETENVAWQVELPGYGQSSPVVWRDRVYVTSVEGPQQDRLRVLCLDLKTGGQLWRRELEGSQGVMTSDYVSKAAPTPVVDADGVCVFFETGDLAAFAHDGTPAWRRSLVADYGRFKTNHGLGASPVLAGSDLVLLVAQNEGSYLLCLDRATGKTRWKKDHAFKPCWTTPLATADGGRRLLIVSANGAVEAFDLKDGSVVWSVAGLAGNTVSSPTRAGDRVIIGSSERNAMLAVRLGGSGDVSGTHVLWRAGEVTGSFASPLAHDGRVYVVNRAGVLFCLDLETGRALWDTRVGACWASPLAAGDRVYCFGTDGLTTVLKAGPAAEKLAENRLPVQGRLYGVAAVDGALLLRTGSRLVRVGR